MKSKTSKTIKNIITFMVLGLIIFVSYTMNIKADTGKYSYKWSVDSYYGIDEDVSPFKAKATNSDVKVWIQTCDGTMKLRVVGALAANPSDGYADCSGRILTITEDTWYETFLLSNNVKQWNYTYAAVLATSVGDEQVTASGHFQVDIN